MAEVIALSARPRKRAGAALVAAVANARRDPDDVEVGAEVEVVVRDVDDDQEGRRRVLPYFQLAP